MSALLSPSPKNPEREPAIPVYGSPGQRIKRLFLTGLLILIPLALTVYILVALFQLMDGIFAPLIDHAVGYFLPGVHIPGLGVLLTLAVIFGIGWLSSNVFGRRLIRVLEKVVCKIPVAKSVYGATKGIMEALSHEQREAFRRVVLVEYPKANIWALGFVTGSSRWPQVDERLSDFLLVFVPTTPNPTSGFLLLVPRSEAIPVPFSVEEGVRLVISGGMLMPSLPASEGRQGEGRNQITPQRSTSSATSQHTSQPARQHPSVPEQTQRSQSQAPEQYGESSPGRS